MVAKWVPSLCSEAMNPRLGSDTFGSAPTTLGSVGLKLVIFILDFLGKKIVHLAGKMFIIWRPHLWALICEQQESPKGTGNRVVCIKLTMKAAYSSHKSSWQKPDFLLSSCHSNKGHSAIFMSYFIQCVCYVGVRFFYCASSNYVNKAARLWLYGFASCRTGPSTLPLELLSLFNLRMMRWRCGNAACKRNHTLL